MLISELLSRHSVRVSNLYNILKFCVSGVLAKPARFGRKPRKDGSIVDASGAKRDAYETTAKSSWLSPQYLHKSAKQSKGQQKRDGGSGETWETPRILGAESLLSSSTSVDEVAQRVPVQLQTQAQSLTQALEEERQEEPQHAEHLQTNTQKQTPPITNSQGAPRLSVVMIREMDVGASSRMSTKAAAKAATTADRGGETKAQGLSTGIGDNRSGRWISPLAKMYDSEVFLVSLY